jgi:UDP-N-acetylmuramyl pentapeptide phosphotransferase/UDP-N-acetylglucosamine-1-phosphate transferase
VFTPGLNIIFSFFSAFIITFLAIPKVIFIAKHLRLIDLAGERSSHKGSVPIFGGIAIFSGFILALLFWSELADIQFILVSLLVVFFVGIIDDLVSLSPLKKLIGQIIAVLIIIYLQELRIDNMYGVLGVFNLSEIPSTLFTIFVTIVITNGFNLIDGVDGLAGGIGIIASVGFGLIAFLMGQSDIAMIAFTLTGGLIAFLIYNVHPGSMVVGMILSVLAINSIREGIIIESIHLPNRGPLLAIVLLAIPLFDSLRVFVNRVRKGKGPLSPGKDHLHHALLDLGYGHRKTALILYLFSILLIFVSYLLLELNLNISIALLTLLSYFIILLPFFILRKRLK